MKHIYVAAGALLLGTSTLAWAADTDKTPLAAKAMVIGAESAKAAQATYAKATSSDETSWTDEKAVLAAKPVATDATIETVALTTKPETTEAKVEMAALDEDLEPLAMAETKPEVLAVKDETSFTGMGGPEDKLEATLTPTLATENYPPCSPGPGDDRCIQLYEPGVRAQLASWNQPTGGLADGSATTAMGGPYEPVEADKLQVAVDSSLETKIETAELDSDVDATSHNANQGVGGPVEAQSGYPPCTPGEGDDRCIQLYEPGVTGAGN